MTKGPDNPKVSFLMPRPIIDRVQRFATKHGMTVSEAMRYMIEAGLEAECDWEFNPVRAARTTPPISPTPRGAPLPTSKEFSAIIEKAAPTTPPTRGKFPRPTGGHHGRQVKPE